MNDPDRHGSSLPEPVVHHRATTSHNEPVAALCAGKWSTDHEKRWSRHRTPAGRWFTSPRHTSGAEKTNLRAIQERMPFTSM